mgnify:CR=1 FL=1
MRFKYFLRGLGVGIVFASLIFFMVYKENATPKMSDKQIIERAKELGMVEEGSFSFMMRMNPGALGRKRKNTSATAFSVIHSIGQLLRQKRS